MIAGPREKYFQTTIAILRELIKNKAGIGRIARELVLPSPARYQKSDPWIRRMTVRKKP